MWPCTRGAQSAPVLAFINGMEERWDFCADAARNLSSRYRTFSLELPWCGARGQGWSARRGAGDWIAEATDSRGASGEPWRRNAAV